MNKNDYPVVSADNNPLKANLLHQIVAAAHNYQLGYVDGIDPDTGETVPLLVGVDKNEDGSMAMYPLGRLFLNVSELKHYTIPADKGKNGYEDEDASEE